MKRRMWIASARIQVYRETEPGFVQAGDAPDQHQLIWLEQGALHCVADGRDIILHPGDLLIYPPGQWHIQYAEIDSSPRYISMILGMEGIDLSPLCNRKFSAAEDISSLLSQALQELTAGDPYSEDMALCLLEIALMRLLRSHSPDVADAPAILEENRIIHRAQQYVSKHVHEKLSVPTVAKNANASPSYLTALFHKHLGISPGEYIRRVKLQRSKELIREGKLNFSQIAEALNYSTVHHFSRQFKDKFGITPTEYAKSIR